MAVALAAIAIALALATAGCHPNEAIVCGSSSENAGASCAANYDLCAGGKRRLECAPGGGGAVTCACLENGVKKRSFQSDDACNVTPDTLKKRAAKGCDWEFDEE